MKQTQNQFFGTFEDMPSILPIGSTYVATNIDKIYIAGSSGIPVSDSSAGTLQAVTDNGNNTTKNIVIDPLGTSTKLLGENLTVQSLAEGTSFQVGSYFNMSRVPTEASYGSGTYGIFSGVSSDSTFIDGGIIGGQLQGKLKGTGGAFYLYGAIINAEHEGSGDVDFIVGNSIRAKHEGVGTGNVNQLRGISTDAEMSGANKTCAFLQGHHNSVNFVAGTVTSGISVNLLDFDYTAGTNTGNFAYLQIQADGGVDFAFTSGHARAINSDSALPSVFAGSITTSELISSAVQTFASEAAAVTALLVSGTIYATATGELRIKL